MKTLIVSGGRTDIPLLKKVLDENIFDLMIACDRGMEAYDKAGCCPGLIVGDFDSVDRTVLKKMEDSGADLVRLIPEKDDTDTEAGIRLALERGASEILLMGATGTRLDHVLGNIQLLGMGFLKNCEITLLDEHNKIRLLRSGITLKKADQYGQFVSLIPFTQTVKDLTLKGFKYELENYLLTTFNSLGISNEIYAEEAEISFSEGILILVEAGD